MYERLTHRDSKGDVWIKDAAHVDEQGQICMLSDRLATYEDSGLSPEEVQKMARAKAEGRLVELPCKVGDTVYWFWVDSEGNSCGDIVEETILYFYIDKNGAGIATKRYDGHIGHYVKDGEIVDGVRRIFLTREAAEKALGGGQVED